MSLEPVIIVHDNKPVGENLVFHASKLSLLVVEANDIFEAVAKMTAHKPSMVVCCHTVGDKTADQLFNEMRAHGLEKVVKIQVGGCEDKKELITAVESGADDIVPYDLVDAIFSSRLSMWIASEFQGLPADVRRRAMVCLRSEEENIRTLDDRLSLNSTLLRDVLLQVQNELQELSPAYGCRYIERMSFLARISMLLIKGGYEFEHFFRFPELAYIICQGVNVPWRNQMPVLFSRFEELAYDSRFASAGKSELYEKIPEKLVS